MPGERECESETVMSLSKGFLPAVAVCLSAPVSPSGCFGREKEGKRDQRTSCVSDSVCVCVCVCVCVFSLKGGKRGIGHCLKIQISQS